MIKGKFIFITNLSNVEIDATLPNLGDALIERAKLIKSFALPRMPIIGVEFIYTTSEKSQKIDLTDEIC